MTYFFLVIIIILIGIFGIAIESYLRQIINQLHMILDLLIERKR